MGDLESRVKDDGFAVVVALGGAMIGVVIGEAGRNEGSQYVQWIGYLFATACGIYSAGAIIYRCLKPAKKD